MVSESKIVMILVFRGARPRANHGCGAFRPPAVAATDHRRRAP
jgi:hypothetical protein